MTGAGEAEYIFHAAQRPALEAWLVSQRLVAHHYADDLATGVPCFVVVPAAELRLTRDVLPRRDDDPPRPEDVSQIVRN